MIDKSKVKRILVITLSNVGDIILTTPVVEELLKEFPSAELDVMVGPRGKEIFSAHKRIREVIIYDKKCSSLAKVMLFFKLRKKRYSLVVDLRNTVFPLILRPRFATNPFRYRSGGRMHKKDAHLLRLKEIDIDAPAPAAYIPTEDSDKKHAEHLLSGLGGKPFVVVSPGAKSHVKRWPLKNFAALSDMIKEKLGYEVVLAGDENDRIVTERITRRMKTKPLNLLEKTNIRELAIIIKKSALLVTNDSAPLHIGSAVGARILAFFGPTDEKKYGPFTGAASKVLRKKIKCSPCEVPQCINTENKYECLKSISTEEAFKAVKDLIACHSEAPRRRRRQGAVSDPTGRRPGGKNLNDKILRPARDDSSSMRILLTRTDRIGDVVLSTPAIKAVRDKYPDAYIVFMVRPYAKDIVEGNPYLDEAIVYDKYGKDRSIFSTVRFALGLRKKKFDLAVMLHPTSRVHLIAYLAGIPERVGFDRKSAIFLTKKLAHVKQKGEKHELEYTLDLLGLAGIAAKDKELFVPIRENDAKKVDELLKEHHVGPDVPIVVINPGASCPSKRWKSENFAAICDALAAKHKARIFIVSDEANKEFAGAVTKAMKYEPVNLAGKTTVGVLAALLSKCNLLISNDSGPVHIACAVGTPVISIFGRKDSGLSPGRWGPTGEKSAVFHKNVGCSPCLAHNCKRRFKCLEAITPAEVLTAAEKLLH